MVFDYGNLIGMCFGFTIVFMVFFDMYWFDRGLLWKTVGGFCLWLLDVFCAFWFWLRLVGCGGWMVVNFVDGLAGLHDAL